MSRDTQFAGFAQLLYDELANNVIHTPNFALGQLQAFKQEQVQIIAQRAYDLAYHVMSEVSIGLAAYNEGGEASRRENMRYIPDLTELPEVSE